MENTYLIGKKREVMKWVGSMEQLAYARKMSLEDGKGRHTRIIEVSNGSGLQFTVVADRGLDIANASVYGIPFAFISKTGITAPALYEEPGTGFLRSFTGGLLTTCGMTYHGAPCEDGEALGLHGRMTSIPADFVQVSAEWEEEGYTIRIKGTIRESRVFGENLVLRREIVTRMGENTIWIEDTYENEGYEEAPFMVLYHSNFGYPFLSDKSFIQGEILTAKDRDSKYPPDRKAYETFESPADQMGEKVYFHTLKSECGRSRIRLVNPELDMLAEIAYDNQYLPCFIEWKLMKSGDYVLGLEPATWKPLGRKAAKDAGELQMIQPGETKTIQVMYRLSDI